MLQIIYIWWSVTSYIKMTSHPQKTHMCSWKTYSYWYTDSGRNWS